MNKELAKKLLKEEIVCLSTPYCDVCPYKKEHCGRTEALDSEVAEAYEMLLVDVEKLESIEASLNILLTECSEGDITDLQFQREVDKLLNGGDYGEKYFELKDLREKISKIKEVIGSWEVGMGGDLNDISEILDGEDS